MTRKVALLIGVSEYEAGLPPLPATPNDVEAMRRVLEKPDLAGFAVETLIDPELAMMQIAINKLFADCHKEDLALLFFSGHGIVDDNGRLYLTTRITDESYFRATSVPASFVHDVMNDSYCLRQVVILDCCYSGAFKGSKGVAGIDVEIKQQLALGSKDRAVLTSSSSTQKSFERKGSGIYTRYLVEGMETGVAKKSETGSITIQELHQYAKEKVQVAKPAMKPGFYSYIEGSNIVLTHSPANNPELEYRREVEKRVKRSRGKIAGIGRKILNKSASKLEISSGVAQRIEKEMLAPYEEHRANLKEYEEVLREELAKENPLGCITCEGLRDFQAELGLRDEDVEAIHTQLGLDERDKEDLQVFNFETVTVNRQGEIIKTETKQAQYFREDLGNDITLDMVAIPGGKFWMGSPQGEGDYSEHPQHKRTVQPFLMGKYPITQAQWRAIAKLPRVSNYLEPEPSKFKGDNRPVERVSWWEAVEFCCRLSQHTGKQYRLPSEAEWEYACRARTTTPFHFGETITDKLANYNANRIFAEEAAGEYRKETTTVGSFNPNAFGLYDMHGNVWEWCADSYHENYHGAPTDSSVWEWCADQWRENYQQLPTDGTVWGIIEIIENHNQYKMYRLLRGGSWSYIPACCRSAYRNSPSSGERRNDTVSFRVVCAAAWTL